MPSPANTGVSLVNLSPNTRSSGRSATLRKTSRLDGADSSEQLLLCDEGRLLPAVHPPTQFILYDEDRFSTAVHPPSISPSPVHPASIDNELSSLCSEDLPDLGPLLYKQLPPTEQAVAPDNDNNQSLDLSHFSDDEQSAVERLYGALGKLDNLLSDELYPAVGGVEDKLAKKRPASDGDKPVPKRLKSKKRFVHKKLSVDITKLSRNRQSLLCCSTGCRPVEIHGKH